MKNAVDNLSTLFGVGNSLYDSCPPPSMHKYVHKDYISVQNAKIYPSFFTDSDNSENSTISS